MAATSLSLSLSPFPLSSSFLSPKPRFFPLNTHNDSSLSLTSKRAIQFNTTPRLEIPPKRAQFWKTSAVSGDALPVEANPVENSEQIVASSGGDGVSTIISVLLFLAFIGLSILTIGVIYIAVTDFLTRRESDKFAKEEAARIKKRKKSGKNKRVIRARAGPRGFGQKREEEEDD
ncbi:hypothetical protein RHMOL_Rhmol13G0095200 [Rhododendron molle]|uniref:Uncharacterized protein n=1 Tax=Rhododendron molle TaxID=49168 RepID=A0ACC0L666_RHOML|nr:hypothetical protein RHMOL_Rhmol13G0095200 [Rhododendron molle]